MLLNEAFEILKKEGITTHVDSVRRWIREGQLKATLPSKREGYRIQRKDLLDFMKTKLTPEEYKDAEIRFINDWDFDQLRAIKGLQDAKAYARKHDYLDLEIELDRCLKKIASLKNKN